MVTDAGDARAYRLSSIDMLRGLAIVIMAIDHVRDFFLAGATQDPLGDPKGMNNFIQCGPDLRAMWF